MSARLRRMLGWGILALACFLALGLAALLLFLKPPDDEVRFFGERRQALALHNIEFLERDRRAIRYTLSLHGDEGLIVDGYLRLPASAVKGYPAVLLLGGLRTGKDALWLLDDLPESDGYVFVTLDYPYDGPTQMSTVAFLTKLGDIRESVWDGVAAMLLGYDFLRGYSVVDTQRIVFVGVSLGSFFVLPAACLASPQAPVALHFAGAAIRELVQTSLTNRGSVWPISSLTAALAAFGLRPLEPARWAARCGGRPVLLVNGANDRRIPVACATRLAEAFPRKPTVHWLEEDHILKSDRNIVLELVALTDQWMKANQSVTSETVRSGASL
jgi:dienelactone hydrolase